MWSPAQMTSLTSRWMLSPGGLCQTSAASPVRTSPTQMEKSYPPANQASVIPAGQISSPSTSAGAPPRSARAPKGSPGLRMKATRVPSGDQVGLVSRSTAGPRYVTAGRSVS